MALDTTDKRDAPQPTDTRPEAADAGSRSLSPAGQNAMQGDSTAALEQRLAQVRAETEAREAAQRAALDQPDDSFHAQSASTELGAAMRAEAGPEKSEVRHFHNVAKPETEGDADTGSEGRLPIA